MTKSINKSVTKSVNLYGHACNTILDVLLWSMAHEEGWDNQDKVNLTRCQQNSNPLNLQFCGQPNAVLEPQWGIRTRRFAKWGSTGEGIAGCYVQLALWIERGLTLHQLVGLQAPVNENNTTAYYQAVLDACVAWDEEFVEERPLYTYLEGL